MSNSVVLIRRNRLWQGKLDELEQAYRENARAARTLLSVGLLSLAILSALGLRAFVTNHRRHLPLWMALSASGLVAREAPAMRGPAYVWVFPSGSVVTDTEVIVLQQVAQQLSCPSDILVDGTTYTLSCVVAMGHSTTVRIQRFTSSAEAQIAFDTARGAKPRQYFHCYPSYSWQYDQPLGDLPMRHRIHSWQADRWLTYIDAFDDTGYLIAPAPAYVSELVRQAAEEHDLFPVQPCTVIVMPRVVKD